MDLRIALWVALLAWPVLGQEGEANAPDDAASRREEVLAAIELPSAAQTLRKRGVNREEVREALRAAKRNRVRARNAKALLDESATAVEENGAIDNFGAFVNAKLNEGLRGRELAAAIRAEHQKRGRHRRGDAKGKPEKDDAGESGRKAGSQGGGKSDNAKGSGSAKQGGGKGKGGGKNK